MGAGIVAVLLFALVVPVDAATDEFEVSIPVETVVRGAEPGAVVTLTDPPVVAPEDLVGRECTVVARSENQSSVHPGNDLVVVTGESQVRIADVEAEPGIAINASGTVLLGPDVRISLIAGQDGVFSAGIDVTVDCAPGATTTTRATTTTEGVTSTDAATTTMGEGSGTDGTVTTEASTTSMGDEVEETEVLPFTGPNDDDRLGMFAMALIGLGLMLVVVGRTLGLGSFWSARCARCDAAAEYVTPHGKLCMKHMRRALFEDSELWVPARIDQTRSRQSWRAG